MLSADEKSIVDRAKRIYADSLQKELEAQHMNRFVTIEPDSGDYFLEDTFDNAVSAATTKYPDRLTYTIRIGHRAVFHMGGSYNGERN